MAQTAEIPKEIVIVYAIVFTIAGIIGLIGWLISHTPTIILGMILVNLGCLIRLYGLFSK